MFISFLLSLIAYFTSLTTALVSRRTVVCRYSPLHTVKTGKEFPALLVTTADHDDRVVPLHRHSSPPLLRSLSLLLQPQFTLSETN